MVFVKPFIKNGAQFLQAIFGSLKIGYLDIKLFHL
jgi:hypothetical protein